MSYILEALKKAQVERQLGTAPTIHVAPVHFGSGAGPAGRWLRPATFAAGAGVLVAGALAWFLTGARAPAPVQVQAPAPPAVAGSAPVAGTLVAAQVVAPEPAPVRVSAVAAQAPVTAPVSAPLQASVTAPVSVPLQTQAPAPSQAPAVAGAAAPRPLRAAPEPERMVPVAAPGPEKAVPPDQAAPAAVADIAAPPSRSLPEQLRREIPVIVLGGYIYSKNPEDRLLLIDKVLRHEGEEVAPGLTLEKVQPKAAVMNYKGVRYSLPY